MFSYCLKRRKNAQSKNPKFLKSKNGRLMLLSKCAACDSKKPKFIKEQETTGLFSSFWTKTPSIKISLVGLLLF